MTYNKRFERQLNKAKKAVLKAARKSTINAIYHLSGSEPEIDGVFVNNKFMAKQSKATPEKFSDFYKRLLIDQIEHSNLNEISLFVDRILCDGGFSFATEFVPLTPSVRARVEALQESFSE